MPRLKTLVALGQRVWIGDGISIIATADTRRRISLIVEAPADVRIVKEELRQAEDDHAEEPPPVSSSTHDILRRMMAANKRK